MTNKQLLNLTKKAQVCAKKFRDAAIDADSAIQAFSSHNNIAARRLRQLSELATGHALDAVLEQGWINDQSQQKGASRE